MFRNRLLAALAMASVVAPTFAQTYRDSGGTIVPGVVSIPPLIGGSASIAVSAIANTVALPASTTNYPALTITNSGANAVFFATGMTATTSSPVLAPGATACISGANASNVAAITGASTSSLQIIQANACLAMAGGSASTGAAGSPSGAVLSVQGISGGYGLPVSGTFWQATQPVSAATLPLPAGAATAANQSAVLSAAGTPATTAVTIQGSSSGSAVPTTLTAPSILGTVTIGSNVATTTSATYPLPSTNSSALQIANAGAYPVSWATGASSIVATVNNTGLGAGTVAAGATANVTAASGGYVAIVASGGSSAVAITQWAALPILGASAGTPQYVAAVPYSYISLAPGQHGLTPTTATALTIPTGARYATVCASTATVRYTTDGATTPTSSVGMPLSTGACVSLSGAQVLANFRAISATATLDVEYFQ